MGDLYTRAERGLSSRDAITQERCIIEENGFSDPPPKKKQKTKKTQKNTKKHGQNNGSH